MNHRTWAWSSCSIAMVLACSDEAPDAVDDTTGVPSPTSTSVGSPSTGSESGTLGTSTQGDDSSGVVSSEGGDGPKFDVLGEKDMGDPTGGPIDTCHVVDDMDAVGDCGQQAPANSFEPAVQWSFGATEQSWVTPLVGNFTDDNGDDSIDLCDVPDVLLVSNTTISYSTPCYLHVLDGETGVEHFSIPPSEMISCTATPAFGDIDDDGLPEIVAVYIDGNNFRLKAFEHDGTPKWSNADGGNGADQFFRESGAVALHDLDADGDVEIVFNHETYDHDGNVLWEYDNPMPGELECTTAADLDGDGEMEVITGHSAYTADGSLYFDNYPTITSQSIPQIGNLDDDDDPEIFITSGQGLWVVEHTGEIKYGPVTPTGVAPSGYLTWQRPGTIHDFDGDQVSDWASSSQQYYAVYQGPDAADVLWQVSVADNSGAAGGTAFDFLGDGVAEAMYADEQFFRIYDGLSGDVLLEQPRFSPTISEYPVVADIDDDGSAEILVVSTSGEPALQAIRDVDDRWIQARRIWNQHAYYVTN
ncbi:MAG: hypothetical protein IAG13_08480, partial [Deltaproteobacteria bacterium]|nr:hypothetical protein [Nannocystaceae bacterium]